MKNNSNLVSIIVPVYNSEKFIKDTIRTVQEQTHKNWEMILVNDCSTDNSISIIEKYLKNDKRIKLINLEKNSGAAIARNAGIEQAVGKYIAFLDSDDLWTKDKLEKQIEFMKKNECAFSFASYEYTKENGIGTGKKAKVPYKINYKNALKNTIIFTSTVMFNMNLLDKKDIYMPNVVSEDTACWWKVLKKVDYAYGLNEILVYYRRSKNTLSSNKFVAIKRIWFLYREYEKIFFLKSCYYFCIYAIRAVLRRI